MDAFMLNGKRNGSYIYHCGDGYRYHFNNGSSYNEGNSQIVYLRCTERNSRGCCGTAKVNVTPNGVEWTNLRAHHCVPCRLQNQILMLRQDILQQCVNPNGPYETPAELVRRVGLGYAPAVAAAVSPERMRSAINRKRNAMYPPIPVSLYNLGEVLADHRFRYLSTCLDGVDSIYANRVLGDNGTCSVIFISRRLRRFMNRYRKVIFCDGTFSSRPNTPNSAQVLQIVAVIGNASMPLVQVLTSGKTEREYVAILQELRRLVPNFRPSLVVTDFELALQNAWRHVFNVHVVGCYWHFCRAVMLHAKELGLHAEMQQNRQFRSLIRSTLAIPLLPNPNLMARAFSTLIREATMMGVMNQVRHFFDYFIDTWMSPQRLQSLSVYGLRHRTNNVSESCNRMLRQFTGNSAQRPKLWRFLYALRKFEYEARLRIRKVNMGLPLNRKQKVSAVNSNRRIQNLTLNVMRGHISINRFLHLASSRVLGIFNRFLA